jgi:trk system potassium uptake protein TrkA
MKIMIIGCGRQGAELAKTLNLNDCEVTVVDNDQTAFERLGPPPFLGQIIHGNGLDRDVLLQGGIERADGVAALTASDDINIVVARLARQVFRVPRVVARVHDPLKAEIYRRLGVLTVNPVALGTQRFAELLTFSPLEPIKGLGNGEVGIVEIDIPPNLVGRMANELTVPGEIQVVAITRDGKTYMPTLGAIFQEHDLIHMAVASNSTDRLKALLGLI